MKIPKVLVPSINHDDGSIQSSTITGFGIIFARVMALLGTATATQVPELINTAITTLPVVTILAEASWFFITIYNIWKDDAPYNI